MELYQINFVEGIPVYRQLVDRLRTNIKNGTLKNGDQLPTVRELSQQLELAQGTVKRAYDELRAEGLVTQIQGRGTFVSHQAVDPESRKERAMAAIDAMLSELEAMNFSMMETRIFLDLKLRDRELIQKNLKIALVECNPEILSQAADQLRRLSGIDVYTYVLEEVRRYPYALAEEMDLIITTMTHADELEQLVTATKKIARVALQLQPRCVGRIVKLPDDYAVGILSGSLRYGDLLRQSCASYADSTIILEPQLLGDPNGCQSLLDRADAILLPEGYEKYCSPADLEQLNRYEQENPLLLCAYQIDEGSFMYLEDKIQRLQAKQRI